MASKLVFGVGLNDYEGIVQTFKRESGKFVQTWRCPIYQLWINMLRRCYSPGALARKPTYIDCHVCDEWTVFSRFKSWVEQQPWQGKQLDKDILYPGCRIYSPETCVFVTGALNKFITDSAAARGKYPIGVSWEGARQKFRGYCSDPFTGRLEFLGYFSSPDLAHEAWRRRKHQHACDYAKVQEDGRVAQALKIRYKY